MPSGPAAFLVFLVPLLGLLGGCASGDGQGSLSERSFDFSSLPLPPKVIILDVGRPTRKVDVEWVKTKEGVTSDGSPQCSPRLRERYIHWRDKGRYLGIPSFFVFLCEFESVEAADSSYDQTSLNDVANQNYPNLEYPEGRSLRPGDMQVVFPNADEGDLVCALGDAEQVCGVWFYRGRYGRFIVRAFYQMSSGGIRFRSFGAAVRAIDEEIGGLEAHAEAATGGTPRARPRR